MLEGEDAESAEILKEFLQECAEGLEVLERDLVALDEAGAVKEKLGSCFRVLHSIKGNAAALGFMRLEGLAHAGESLLVALREGRLEPRAELTSALLAMHDGLAGIVAELGSSGAEGQADFSELVQRLSALEAPKDVAATALLSVVEVPRTELRVELREAPAADAAAAALAKTAVLDGSVRVSVELLDSLMNLVGELVLVRNRTLTFAAGIRDAAHGATIAQLDHITSELHAQVMKTRMQPVGQLMAKLPRLVRELCHACDKEVVLSMTGAETELDRVLLEAVRDPLTHLVRNAIDHGIERAQVRVAQGKPRAGSVSISGRQTAGSVVIEVTDDGAGVDGARLLAKAIEIGAISASMGQELSEREQLQLLFLPGLSTAKNLTHISGRGVGMDVVKSQVERIGGSVDVRSQRGRGTTFVLRIPLTLAILPALVVSSGNERFLIPQANLIELVCPRNDSATVRIEEILGTPLCRLRGALLPLVRLDQLLGVGGQGAVEAPGEVIAVLQTADGRFALLLDHVDTSEEIVVKALGPEFSDARVYSGATILGDGSIALILDAAGVASAAGIQVEPLPATERRERTPAAEGRLLIAAVGSARVALPLAQIDRLITLELRDVERASGRSVIQHHGQILPIMELAELMGIDERRPTGANACIAVCTVGGRCVGAVVDEIVDIVDDVSSTAERAGELVGVARSVVIGGRVADILDLEALAARIDPDGASRAA